MIAFEDKSAQRVFDQYQRQVDHMVVHLSVEDKKEIKLEITSHLHESMQRDAEDREIDKLLNAIDKLGSLEEYLGPLVADKLIEQASSSLRPGAVIRAFVYNLGRSAKRTSLFIFFGVIYLFVISLFVAGIAKFFVPEIGLYVGEGNFVIGTIDKPDVEEVLGFWITPIAFALAGILYVFTTRILKILALKK